MTRKKKAKFREDFLDAIDQVVAGLERKQDLSLMKKIIAYRKPAILVSWLLKREPRLKFHYSVAVIGRRGA
jgi:hypothetical protein